MQFSDSTFQRSLRPARWRVDGETRVLLAVIYDESRGRLAAYQMEQTQEHFICPAAWWGSSSNFGSISNLDMSCELWKRRPQPGSRWQECRASTCVVVFCAFDVVDGGAVVVYRRDGDGLLSVCLLADWYSYVPEHGCDRFEELTAHEDRLGRSPWSTRHLAPGVRADRR